MDLQFTSSCSYVLKRRLYKNVRTNPLNTGVCVVVVVVVITGDGVDVVVFVCFLL